VKIRDLLFRSRKEDYLV